MIVRDRPSRTLSRAGRLGVVALAVFVLPLLAGCAEPEADEEPAVPEQVKPREPAVPERATPGVGAASTPSRDVRTRKVQVPPRVSPIEVVLRDEIELLEVQREAKAAQIQVTETSLRFAEGRKQFVTQAGGAVSRQELLKAEEEVESLTAQMAVRRAELREAEVKLQQARRRLEALAKEKSAEALALLASNLFQKTVIDLGNLTGKAEATGSATLVNQTHETFRIAAVRSSSTALRVSARSTELKPGDQGTIAFHLDPTRIKGPQTFKVIVEFSQPRKEEVVLEVIVNATAAGNNIPLSRTVDDARLKGLEQRLDALLKDIDSLKSELRRSDPRRK